MNEDPTDFGADDNVLEISDTPLFELFCPSKATVGDLRKWCDEHPTVYTTWLSCCVNFLTEDRNVWSRHVISYKFYERKQPATK